MFEREIDGRPEKGAPRHAHGQALHAGCAGRPCRTDLHIVEPDRYGAGTAGLEQILGGGDDDAVDRNRARRHHLAVQDVRTAEEAGDELGPGLFVDLLRAAKLLDAALIHHDDTIGGGHRLGLIMGDVDCGEAVFVMQAAQFEAHLFTQRGVEIGERFVKQQRFRLYDQRARKSRPLLLAAGQLGWIAVGQRTELHHVEHGAGSRRDLGARQPAQRQAVGDILRDRHMRPERIALEDHRHVATLRRQAAALPGQAPPADVDLARGRRDEAGDQPQRRALAAAGWADHAEQFAVAHGNVDGVHDGLVAVLLRQPDECHLRHIEPQRPVKFGLRFSMKAWRPSM